MLDPFLVDFSSAVTVKATKANTVAVPDHLWDKRVVVGFPRLNQRAHKAGGTHVEKKVKGVLKVLRKLALDYWKQKVEKDMWCGMRGKTLSREDGKQWHMLDGCHGGIDGMEVPPCSFGVDRWTISKRQSSGHCLGLTGIHLLHCLDLTGIHQTTLTLNRRTRTRKLKRGSRTK
jgi:hypothetical protein